MDTIAVNGINIAYTQDGSGDPVLLIGGGGMPAMAWDFSIKPALIEAGYRVATFDGRGVGQSSAPPPPYSVQDMATDTIGVIEHVIAGPCRLVGLSLGGFVAEDVCWQRPDLVESVVMIASAGPTTAFMRAKMRAEDELFAGDHPVPHAYDLIDTLTIVLPPKVLQDDDAAVQQWASMLSSSFYPDESGRLGQYAAVRRWLLDDSRTTRWPDMRVRPLFIAFEHDLLFPPGRARQAAELWPRATVREIAGVAHGNGPFAAADKISQAILEFFATGS
jgi:pimeloyl-ACP methyl ester carboxylesterase